MHETAACEPEAFPCAALCTWSETSLVRSALSSKGLNGTLPAALGNVTALTALCVLVWHNPLFYDASATDDRLLQQGRVFQRSWWPAAA